MPVDFLLEELLVGGKEGGGCHLAEISPGKDKGKSQYVWTTFLSLGFSLNYLKDNNE